MVLSRSQRRPMNDRNKLRFPVASALSVWMAWQSLLIGNPFSDSFSIDYSTTFAADVPTDLKSIGGHWFVRAGDKPVYFYRDGERFVDLFSYHTKDSNKDGIDNVRVSHDDQFLIVESQGYPNHPTAVFPNRSNPNTIRVQNFTFRFPLAPKKADKVTRVPMGPIGMANNGVVFFNPFEAGGMNAVEGYSEVWLDSCCGHPQQTGVYHYHKYPSCVKSPFPDNGKQHSPILGFAFDGFPIYGPYESEGVMARDLKDANALDACNGHSDDARGYHYHVTPGRFPYIIGGYTGIPEYSNNRGLRRAASGAIQNNAEGESRLDKTIASIRPEKAQRGKTHSIQIELDPSQSRRPIPDGKPSWVQIGPYEAKAVTRDRNVIKVDIEIGEDANLEIPLDCHIEFEDSNRAGDVFVIKKNEAFQVEE